MTSLQTPQDYAASVIQGFAAARGFPNISAIAPKLNSEKFRTIAEFQVAWSRILHLLEEGTKERDCRLPVGQPREMTAFADAASPNLQRGRWQFMPRELFPDDYVGMAGIWAILTTDKQEDGWHICFTRRWGRSGLSVAKAIERLATAIYHEGKTTTPKEHAPCIDLASGGKQRFPRKPAQVDSKQLHFYEHTPPTRYGEANESFARVTMIFKNEEFIEPTWQHYPIIPETVQCASFGLALIQALAITELLQ